MGFQRRWPTTVLCCIAAMLWSLASSLAEKVSISYHPDHNNHNICSHFGLAWATKRVKHLSAVACSRLQAVDRDVRACTDAGTSIRESRSPVWVWWDKFVAGRTGTLRMTRRPGGRDCRAPPGHQPPARP